MRILLLFILVMFVNLCSASVWHIASLVVFGSGDSDNGRSLSLYHIPVDPPYWHGRFSNGPAWDEYLAYNLHLIPNPAKHPNYNKHKFFLAYAYYFATATREYSSDGAHLMTFDDEINQYRNDSKPFPANTLAVIDIGENDLFNPQCSKQPMQCLTAILNAEKQGMMRLCKMRVKHFLVMTPADQEELPYSVREYSYERRQQLALMEGNYGHQFASLKNIVERDCPKSQVLVYYSLPQEKVWMMRFKQPVHIPCYWNIQNNEFVYNRQVGPVCKDPNQYYYFDAFYGSSASSKLWGGGAYQAILNNHWNLPRNRHWWQSL